MKIGSIRSIRWNASSSSLFGTLALEDPDFVKRPPAPLNVVTPSPVPLDPVLASPLASAVDEAKLLLRIAAEGEGALLVQYLYSAYSILPNVVLNPAGAANPIVSDDWYNTIRDIAKQEMGHLITVQNLL